MGKVLWTDEDQFDNNHPGCISGIFHALHHQYWHSNVKKIIRHNTNHKANRRYTRVSDNEDPFEFVKLLDPETSHILVDKSNKKTSSTQKKSLKARIKALVSEEQNQEAVSSPRLQRTYSVHHSESNEWIHPIIFFPENQDILSNPSNVKNKDSRDILEMFEVDKELFTNILQETSQLSDTKPKLTKSGSFPSGRNLKPTTLKDKLNDFYKKSKSKKSDSSNYNDFNNHGVHIKRASSLNEDRYARLFDFNVTNEGVLRPSRSLKLTNKSDNFSNAQDFSFVTRNPVSFPLGLDSMQDCECLNEDVIDKSDNLSEEEIQSDFHISKENLEKKTEKSSKRKQYKDDDDYSYVKGILERSGFIKNGFEQTWCSSNQLLNPFLFQEIESEYVHDPDQFEEELSELSHRLLIFELVDDFLITMYERSLTYYPKSLSSLCHIHPAPSGSVLVDEVWKRVSRLVELKPDMSESLDCIVSRDLGSDDGWMNLQLDSECVALDLEDLILDEILEELLCECS